MEFYDWLLALHVLAAFSLVAALVLYTVVIASSWNLTVPSDVARLFRVSRVGDVAIAVGSIGTLVFGVWLAIDSDDYQVWDGWVIAALVLWALSMATGSRTGAAYNAVRVAPSTCTRSGKFQSSGRMAARTLMRRACRS